MRVRTEKFYGWRIAVVGVIIMSTVYAIAMNCAPLFVKPISEAFHVSRSQVSLLPAIITLTFAFCSPFVGKIASKFGVKQMMTVGALIVGLGLIGYSMASGIKTLYMLSIPIGVGLTLSTIIPINMLINNWFVEKKGFVVGLVFAGSGIGGFVFAQVTRYMLINHTWTKGYLLLGGILLAVALPAILLMVKQTPEEIGQKPYGYKAIKTSSQTVGDGYTLKEIKKSWTFKKVVLSCFMLNLISVGFTAHYAAHLSDVGHSTSFVANVSSLLMLSVVFAKVILGSIYDKIGGQKGYVIGVASLLVGFLLLIFAAYKAAAISFGVLVAIGASMGTVSVPLLINDLFGEKDYSSIYGFVNLIAVIGAAMGAPVSGVIFDKTGSYNVAWVLYIVLALVMSALVYSSYNSMARMDADESLAVNG